MLGLGGCPMSYDEDVLLSCRQEVLGCLPGSDAERAEHVLWRGRRGLKRCESNESRLDRAAP